VELRVHRLGADPAGVEFAPDREEALVVGTPAQRARAMSRRERRGLVEEEELGEPTRHHQRTAVPSPEPEPAGDPALAVVAPPDTPVLVVQTAAIPVHKATGGIGDELPEGSDPILKWHLGSGA